MINTRRIAFVTTIVGLLAASSSFATMLFNEDVPFYDLRYVECVGDFGDLIELSGTVHVMWMETYDQSGASRWRQHVQVKKVNGYGWFTGDTYRATGLFEHEIWQTLAAPPYGTLPLIISFISNLNLIGQGGTVVNFQNEVHVTVDPNAQLRVDIVEPYNPPTCR